MTVIVVAQSAPICPLADGIRRPLGDGTPVVALSGIPAGDWRLRLYLDVMYAQTANAAPIEVHIGELALPIPVCLSASPTRTQMLCDLGVHSVPVGGGKLGIMATNVGPVSVDAVSAILVAERQ